ncbi:MAG TPA: Ku protein [Streptosporangiaceae bacterium]
MWKGGISFGLVMIPVRLYAATEQKDIAFRQVHRADGGRIRFRRFCSVCGEEVPYEDVVKGYELSTGEMVVLDDEDLADLPLPTTKSIEVLHFAPAEQLDPILFNRSYFVEPEAAGARAYVLLRDALEQSGRIAIAQVALRQRESLATLRSRDGVLVLETLLWPDEVREASFPFLEQDIEVRPQELTMASSLIDSMTSDFEPDAHHDGYREALIEVVEAKVAGHELTQPAAVEIAAGPSTSLADALRASLAAAQQAPAAGENTDKAKAVGDGSTAGAAKGRSTRSGAAKSGPAKSGPAKSGPAKSGTAKSAAAKDEAASGEEAPAKGGSGKTRQSRAKSPAKPARKAS